MTSSKNWEQQKGGGPQKEQKGGYIQGAKSVQGEITETKFLPPVWAGQSLVGGTKRLLWKRWGALRFLLTVQQ